MKTQTLEEMKKNHAAEIARFERQETIVPLLPVPAQSICAHDGKCPTMSVSYEAKTLAEALKIYHAYLPAIVDAEAWKGGCISVQPAELNRYAKEERAELLFTAHCEICLHSYGEKARYQDQELHFFAKVGSEMLRVSVKIEQGWGRVAYWHEGSRGEPGSMVIRLPSLGEDERLRWWSPDHNYNASYYWADTHNFCASMDHELARMAKEAK